MDLSIIIVNWNTRQLLINCLKSIFLNVEDIIYEVWVVDNGSSDGSPQAVRSHFPQVKLIENRENKGFAGANNQVLRNFSSRYALLLNSDTIIEKGAIELMIDFMDQTPSAAICSPQYLKLDNTKQNSFDNFPSLATELLNKKLLKILFPAKYPSKRKEFRKPIEVDSLIGACLAVRKESIDQVGALDEDYFFFLEETDWCYRMRQAGLKIYHLPHVRIYHLQGSSKNKNPAQAWIEYYRSCYLFFKKHRSLFSWLILRFFRPLKLFINLLLTTIAFVFTLGKRRSLRRKFTIYFKLCIWHLLLCPSGMGLKGGKERFGNGGKNRGLFNLHRDGINFWIREESRDLFVKNTQLDFRDMNSFPGFLPLKDSKIKMLASVCLDPENSQKKYLIKIYKYPGFYTKFKYLFRPSKGYQEWKLAGEIKKRGVPTLLPIAFGERKRWGFRLESLVMTEQLSDCINLEELFLGKELRYFTLKRKIIEEYGKLAGRIHNRGILQDDFDPNNILLHWKGKRDFLLFLIDFERVKLFKVLSVKKKVRSLAKLNRMGRRLRRTDRLRFLKSYLKDDLQGRNDLRRWLRLIQEDEKRVKKRDCRRAAKKSMSRSARIGYLKHENWRGYYQKRYHDKLKFQEKEILNILHALEKKEEINAEKGVFPGEITFEMEIASDKGREKFQVKSFRFSGITYPILRFFKRSPLLMAWEAAQILLKRRIADFLPVAAIEKKTSRGRYQGFLITKLLSITGGRDPFQ